MPYNENNDWLECPPDQPDRFLAKTVFELLSALWVIPRKRTSGEKAGRFRTLTRRGRWRGARNCFRSFFVKERLQGSSLLLPSGEEAKVKYDGSRRALHYY